MPELPRGTVTFLFTDIEASTERWERDRQAMAAAVDRHLALLRVAIEANRGVAFKVVGDAVQAAFPSAPLALVAALNGQRALLVEDWSAVRGLHVRMALHAGEAEPDERGDYLAPALNRLSRLLAAGHGGQILLTQVVRGLAGGALPDAVSVRDLGEHRLRDLLEPERIYQLLHRDLPCAFPPLATLETHLTNLPRQPTPFLGREREIAEVVALLRREEVQLLTLTGPGGSGKTRLGLEAAVDLLEEFPDGVFLVPLASLTDPALIVTTIASAVGLRMEGGRPVAENLREFLSEKRLLLVLDNVEHLVESAPVIGELLGVLPGLKVLATSRVPLHLRAEHEYPVAPLRLPRRKPPPTLEQLTQYEAVRLFIARARAVKPGFVVDNENAPAVAEICHRLDGLPLAIELAAARVRLLPPHALLARLDQRLPVLVGGARDAPARQRTLRDTIAWSHDLLAAEEQALFRRLAVFAGGCTLEAAEAIVNPGGDLDVFGGMERLVEQSLLRQEMDVSGEPRFAMLETIREFALERLTASGEAATARDPHARYFLELAEATEPHLEGSEQARWLDRLEAEHANLRAALSWLGESGDTEAGLRLASALGLFWFMRGHLGEGRAWLGDLLAATAMADSAAHAKALNAAGLLARYQGDYGAAAALIEQALAIHRTLADQKGIADALSNLGYVLFHRGESTAAREHYEQALTINRALGNRQGVADDLSHLAAISLDVGEPATARALHEESLAIWREVRDRQGEAWALYRLGLAILHQGEDSTAAALFGDSLTISREIGFQWGIAEALEGLAALAAGREAPETALRLGGAAAVVRAERGIPPSSATQAALIHRVETAGKALPAESAAAAYTAGRELPLEQVIDEALVVAGKSSRLAAARS